MIFRSGIFWKILAAELALAAAVFAAARYYINGPAAALSIAAAALLLAYLLSRPIVKESKEIAECAEELSRSNFGERVAARGGSELARAARALNRAAERLGERMTELEEERNLMSAVLSGMIEGVLAVDSSGRAILINQALAQIFRLDPQQGLGKTPLELVGNNELARLFAAALEEEKQTEAIIRVSLPSERFFKALATPLISPEGRVIGAVAVLHDITELRRLEAMRRDFVANISHELRTPLASIQGYAETLLDGALDDRENNRRFVEIIKRQAEGLARMAEELLTLSAVESEGFQLKPTEFEVGELVEAALSTLGEQAARKKQKIEVALEPGLRKMRGDRERLARVLINLLDNAIKFTHEQGRIVISARETAAGQIAISVSDDGIGIPRQELPRIFERFYRVDKGRSREPGGTGLGLAIAKHIVEAHGGSIGVESAPGRGSKFTVILPRV